MMKKILITTLLSIFVLNFGQVGIRTTNPQGAVHIDGSATPAVYTDDFIIKNDGKVGIGNINPTVQLEVTAKVPTGTTTTSEGIVIPRVSLEKLKLMGASGQVQEGNLVYVNDVTGIRDATTNYVLFPGYFFWNGTYWVRIMTFDDKRGLNVNSLMNPVASSTTAPDITKELTCGRFVFRLNGTTGSNGYPQFKLSRDPGATGAEIRYGVQREYSSDLNAYYDMTKNFTSANYNTYQRLDNNNVTLGATSREIAIAHMIYPGDTDYYRVEFYKANSIWVMACSRF